MGYVWCDGYVWDMCGVRYANNLLKNPATKRLSGIIYILICIYICLHTRTHSSMLREMMEAKANSYWYH